MKLIDRFPRPWILIFVLSACSDGGGGSIAPGGTPAPTAEFTADAVAGEAPHTVSFTDLSSDAGQEWYWEFGDGQTSTLQNPVHTYQVPDTYSVRLIAVGPAGADEEFKPAFVVVAHPRPAAEFSGSPNLGATPMPVAFVDKSKGQITSRTWTFGDPSSGSANTSSLADPSHDYANPGNYDVTLEVTGPGGTDTLTKPAYVVATVAIGDGSFEAQAAGAPPTAPWTVSFGTGHLIRPAGAPTDNGMPTLGSKWCELSTQGTSASTPPSNPGGTTAPPVGGAGISQPVRYPTGRSLLKLEAAFVNGEGGPNSGSNDWLSVDVTDGTTTRNLYYRDTLSPTSTASPLHAGRPMTPVETVRADLAVLFPSSSTSTSFLLTIQVGNGGDAQDASFGYVDNFRFESPATSVLAEFTPSAAVSNVSPFSVTFAQATQNASQFFWNFGDPANGVFSGPSLPSVQHTFTSPPNTTTPFTVTLKAVGAGGSFEIKPKIAHVVVSDAAMANFCVRKQVGTNCVDPCSDTLDGPLNMAVCFTNSSTGANTFSWKRNGVEFSTLQNPPPLILPGSLALNTHTITLTVEGDFGSQSTDSVIVRTHQPPAPSFAVVDPCPVNDSDCSCSGQTPSAHLAVNHCLRFTGSNTGGQVTSWQWSFGDGGSASGQVVTHTYVMAKLCDLSQYGNRTILLSATGPGGGPIPSQQTKFIRPTFDMVQAIFDGVVTTGDDGPCSLASTSCLGCHDTVGTTCTGGDGGLDLTDNCAFGQLVGVPAVGDSDCTPPAGSTLVVANSASTSYLIQKLKGSTGSDPQCDEMPPLPSTAVQAELITLIRDWIAGGAVND